MSEPTSKEPDAKYHPCNVCGVDAVACLRPDMDIKGLCFCEVHRDEVYMVYMLVLDPEHEKQVRTLTKKWKYK